MPELDTSIISLRFNGQTESTPIGTTLADMLLQQAIPCDGVATAINGQFVPRELRANRPLEAGDDVITFQAIVGG